MNDLGSLLSYLRDPKLAAHATSALPAWLWSADATRVLWANPTAAAAFDVASPAALAGHTIDPKGSAALQIARIAGTLPLGAPPRLERLRGFGARLGRALMCACSRINLEDRTPAILVLATELVGAGLPLAERVRRLGVGIDTPIAFFSGGGDLMDATPDAEARLLGLKSLAALGADTLAGEALVAGRASGTSHLGPITLERIGSDDSIVLLASFPQAAQALAAEPVADSTPAPAKEQSAPAAIDPGRLPPATPMLPVEPQPAEPLPPPSKTPVERRQSLRFVWQMDANGRLTIGTEEFATAIGPQAAATLSRPWREIATDLNLDTNGQIERAIASRDTWSNITVAFPVDDAEQHLPVELSGLPVFDRERNLLGYRGFGVCRDAAMLATMVGERNRNAAATQPNSETPKSEVPTADTAKPEQSQPRPEPPVFREERPALSVVPPIENVLPFRSSGPAEKSPSLTPVERKTFNELGSTLSARLREAHNRANNPIQPEPEEPAPPEPPVRAPLAGPPKLPAAATAGSDQRPILDRLPLGVLVYRLDRLIYANRAFLDWTGYGDINALTDAGGLDALFIEPHADEPGQNGARALSITTSHGSQMPIEARLFSTPWDGESALVLMLTNGPADDRAASPPDTAPSATETEARELRSILDTAADGVVLLDREGRIIWVNRSAEALFGYQSRELSGLPFAGLFAPESQRTAFEELDRVNREGAASVLAEGREVLGRGHEQAAMPLFMTVGQVSGSEKLCAVFRNLALWKKAEEDLLTAKQQAERASSAKSDFLAKISHEIRTPLNAIIGFSEVMMEERFGPVGNERYKQYLKDIHTSGGHLISLLNDLLDLSKIEAGKLELDFAKLDLNELIQQCVGLMQPQANRERIIIRTALSGTLPPVLADARSVRQIALNLLSNSIKFTGAGGQVIVSTAVNDIGEVALRVRDTGVGMSEKEIAIALEPFRQLATSARFGSGGTGLGLPLTKALAEANRATFSIKSAVNAGTLIEVAFSGTPIAAE